MTPAQQNYKKQLIQKIQVNKHNVFFDDEERRDFIVSRFGVDSTTKMSIDELNHLLNFCQRKVSDIEIDVLSSAQLKKIKDLWKQKARVQTEHALWAFICKIAKRELEDINKLTKREATKVIVALKRMC
jgi:phage gp16-like protein